MKTLLLICFFWFSFTSIAQANYERNKAVAVEKVLFGAVQSVRNITESELVEDRNLGWKVFGGALIGGVIGNQFGSGSGRDVANVLGALLGGSMANNKNEKYSEKTFYLIELMIKTDEGKEYMVVQDKDSSMIFMAGDFIRMIYLANGMVRIDKQM